MNTHRHLYDTARWERKRRAILMRDTYTDQIQLRYGKHIPANTVHHIFPRSAYPEYQWCDWNLISVSEKTHSSLHDRTNGELTKEGRELLERTARKQGISLE